MNKLDDFEVRLNALVDSIYRVFCLKIIQNGSSFMYRSSKEFNTPHKFQITNISSKTVLNSDSIFWLVFLRHFLKKIDYF